MNPVESKDRSRNEYNYNTIKSESELASNGTAKGSYKNRIKDFSKPMDSNVPFSKANSHLRINSNENFYVNKEPLDNFTIQYDYISLSKKQDKNIRNNLAKKSSFNWQLTEFDNY